MSSPVIHLLAKRQKGKQKILHNEFVYTEENKEAQLDPQRQFKQRFKFCSALRSDWHCSELNCKNVSRIFFPLLNIKSLQHGRVLRVLRTLSRLILVIKHTRRNDHTSCVKPSISLMIGASEAALTPSWLKELSEAGLLMFALISICAHVFVYAHLHVSPCRRFRSNHPKRFLFFGRLVLFWILHQLSGFVQPVGLPGQSSRLCRMTTLGIAAHSLPKQFNATVSCKYFLSDRHPLHNERVWIPMCLRKYECAGSMPWLLMNLFSDVTKGSIYCLLWDSWNYWVYSALKAKLSKKYHNCNTVTGHNATLRLKWKHCGPSIGGVRYCKI